MLNYFILSVTICHPELARGISSPYRYRDEMIRLQNKHKFPDRSRLSKEKVYKSNNL